MCACVLTTSFERKLPDSCPPAKAGVMFGNSLIGDFPKVKSRACLLWRCVALLTWWRKHAHRRSETYPRPICLKKKKHLRSVQADVPTLDAVSKPLGFSWGPCPTVGFKVFTRKPIAWKNKGAVSQQNLADERSNSGPPRSRFSGLLKGSHALRCSVSGKKKEDLSVNATNCYKIQTCPTCLARSQGIRTTKTDPGPLHRLVEGASSTSFHPVQARNLIKCSPTQKKWSLGNGQCAASNTRHTSGTHSVPSPHRPIAPSLPAARKPPVPSFRR